MGGFSDGENKADAARAAEEPRREVTVMQARPVAPREVRVVDDVIPVLDTARFEHMQRIANVMAASSLIPRHLVAYKDGTGDNAPWVDFPREVVQANCFLIVNQAVGWNADPFAVAPCTSIVHGRLMFEGKLVAAILEAKLGTRLRYDFGRYENGRVNLELGEPEKADDEGLGVVVSGTRPGDTEPVSIDGWVSAWKTTGNNSPWSKQANWRRQLRYRGAREWARAYAAGVLLGVITDDEIDERLEVRAQVAEQARPRLTGGFGPAGGGAPALAAPAAQQQGSYTATAAGQATNASTAAVVTEAQGAVTGRADPPHDPATGELIEEGGGQAAATDAAAPAQTDAPAPKKRGRPSKAEIAAREEAARQAAAAAAPQADAAVKVADPADPALATQSGGTGDAEAALETVATAGGDLIEGEIVRTGGGPAELEHVGPEAVTADRPISGAAPIETAGVPNAESAPGSSASATDASPASPAPSASGPAASSKPPVAGPAAAERPQAFGAFASFERDLEKLETWPEIKTLLTTLAQTSDWKGAEAEAQRCARLDTWDRLTTLQEEGVIPRFALSTDVQAFRLWLETTPKADAIATEWRNLNRDPAFAALSQAGKDSMAKIVADVLGAARSREGAAK